MQVRRVRCESKLSANLHALISVFSSREHCGSLTCTSEQISVPFYYPNDL